jgi:hypothetical protein
MSEKGKLGHVYFSNASPRLPTISFSKKNVYLDYSSHGNQQLSLKSVQFLFVRSLGALKSLTSQHSLMAGFGMPTLIRAFSMWKQKEPMMASIREAEDHSF